MIKWVMYDTEAYELVDTSKFDVVEKKEAKIARLDEELNNKLKVKKYYEDNISYQTNIVISILDEIDKIKAELEELEK